MINLHALCIGVSAAPGAPPIPPAAYEAGQVHLRLTARGASSTLLTGGRATSLRVRTEMLKLSTVSKENDHVIIYFNGHGGRDTDEPRDDNGSSREYLRLTEGVIYDSDFRELLTSLDGRNVTFLLDACHAGGMAPSVSSFRPSGTALRKGWWHVLASAGENDLALSSDEKSPFTTALLEQLDADSLPKTPNELLVSIVNSTTKPISTVRTLSSPEVADTPIFWGTEPPQGNTDSIQAHVLFGFQDLEHCRLCFFHIEESDLFCASMMSNPSLWPTTAAQYHETTSVAIALSFTHLGLTKLNAAHREQVGAYSTSTNIRTKPTTSRTSVSAADGIEYSEASQPITPDFEASPALASERLNDPWSGKGSVDDWKVVSTDARPIHGLFIFAGSPADIEAIETKLAHCGASVVYTEDGVQRHGKHGSIVLPDGISRPGVAIRSKLPNANPRFAPKDSTSIWPLRYLLLREQESIDLPTWAIDGSFLVYRRLTVDAGSLTDQLHLSAPEQIANAVSLLIGRTIDGRSLADDSTTLHSPAAQRFDYDQFDYTTGTCPAFAHARKTNPRQENGTTIFRRGASFEAHNEPPGQPETGVHFMCYQASIENQFGVISAWMNETADEGVDALMGRATRGTYPTTRSFMMNGATFTLNEFIFPTGGAYLFAPSIVGLRTLFQGFTGSIF